MRYLLILSILLFTACQNSNETNIKEETKVKITPMPNLPDTSTPTDKL